MKGLYTPITKIRREVFTQLARMAYENKDETELDVIPYRIIKGEVPKYRDNVFIERAIVGERLRLALGLPLRAPDESGPVSSGAKQAMRAQKVMATPLINVIPFACDACPTKSYVVTDNCRGCLAHPCTVVCPVKAVSMQNGHSVIDQEKCIRCGRCMQACPYNAIVCYDRPCAASCGVNAIESDELGRAKINQEKCVSCGQCLVNCPFGAIADKTEIYQVIRALAQEQPTVAIVAPAFVGQFGPLATWERLCGALLALGFADVTEVAHGAAISAGYEAEHYLEKVGKEIPFLGTSCCPSWKMMVDQNFPELRQSVSGSLTPMIISAQLAKKERPDCKVVFIGPCSSKKLEACFEEVQGIVDYVLTFEELMGMLIAKDIEFDSVADTNMPAPAQKIGRGYAVSGGVTDAITAKIHETAPDADVPTDKACGLDNCRKMMQIAKAGKRDGYLIEGMACPQGCVGGCGTILPINKAAGQVGIFAGKGK